MVRKGIRVGGVPVADLSRSFPCDRVRLGKDLWSQRRWRLPLLRYHHLVKQCPRRERYMRQLVVVLISEGVVHITRHGLGNQPQQKVAQSFRYQAQLHLFTDLKSTPHSALGNVFESALDLDLEPSLLLVEDLFVVVGIILGRIRRSHHEQNLANEQIALDRDAAATVVDGEARDDVGIAQNAHSQGWEVVWRLFNVLFECIQQLLLLLRLFLFRPRIDVHIRQQVGGICTEILCR
mmetsp:Transcript_10318/g.29007  ORF Transcript_10318/g.29007 Transcript_10318/m.29007 type:complete len:236 (-) Transcript_10318:476-1183(-)